MRNKLLKVSILLFGLIILSSSFVFGQEEHDLKLNFAVGDEYILETVITQNITQNLMGMEINMDQEMELAYNFVVKEITSDGNYIISVKYTEFDLDMSDFSMSELEMPQEVEGDNGENIDEEIDEFSQNLIGEKFKMELTAKGEVVSISNYQKLTDEILTDLDDPTAKDNLAEISNEEYLKQSWEQFLTYLPENEVAVGDSWDSSFEINHPITMEVLNNYKLETVNEENVIISFGSDSKLNNISFNQDEQEEMRFDFEGQQSGEIFLNPKSNWIEKMDLTQRISGSLTVTIDQQGQQFRIPMELITELKASGERL